MINIRGYNKRRKRLTSLIKSLHPAQERVTGIQRRAIVYFLDVATFDESRRSARAERPEKVDAPADNAPLKDSAKY